MTGPKPQSTSYYCRKTRKRPYRKSTKDCKARKIKCDEKRPICGNCTRRYVGISCCEYPSTGEGEPSPSADSSIPSRSTRREILPLANSPTVTPFGLSHSDTLQLRLMYHYTKSTCGRHIISTVPLLPLSLWEIEIPQVAFSNELVLNAMLGISAVHLLSLNPEDQTLVLASGRYLDKALKQHRAAVEVMDSQNAEALIIAAILIAHHSWLAASTRTYQEPYRVDLGTYRMCQGINALVAKAAPWLLTTARDSSVGANVEVEYLPFPPFLESAQKDMDILLHTLEDESATQEVKDVYAQVADQLMGTYSRIAHGSFVPPIEQDISAFLQRAPQLFVEHLAENKPIAMAMMARDIALLGILPDSSAWWIHGAGRCRMANTTVEGVCGLMPPEYLWMMVWPLKIISGDINLEV